MTMTDLREAIRQCTNCHLHSAHNGPVPGYFGKPYGLLIIGEAPGNEEDRPGQITREDIEEETGEPLIKNLPGGYSPREVGEVKKFLDAHPDIHKKLMLKKMGAPFVGVSGRYLRAKLKEYRFPTKYISFCNAISCRPTGKDNRNPRQDELHACRGNLLSQVAFAKPRIVLTVGTISSRLFYPNIKVAIDHGRPVWLSKIRIQIPTYHPAFILRKKKEWEHVFEADLVEVKKRLWNEKLDIDWPEDCRICKKPVEKYDKHGLAYCNDHYTREMKVTTQPGMF